MGDARSRQVRMEKKRRRREKRRQARLGGTGNSTEVKYSVRFVITPEGRVADPAQLAPISSALMSDALVELMRPYISWPPASDELDDLEAWLRLGAEVWNATVEAKDGAACARDLARLASDLDDDAPIDLVHQIAQRKFARFANDRRRVGAVRVVARDGRAMVEAMSLAYVPGAAR